MGRQCVLAGAGGSDADVEYTAGSEIARLCLADGWRTAGATLKGRNVQCHCKNEFVSADSSRQHKVARFLPLSEQFASVGPYGAERHPEYSRPPPWGQCVQVPKGSI